MFLAYVAFNYQNMQNIHTVSLQGHFKTVYEVYLLIYIMIEVKINTLLKFKNAELKN